MLNDIVDPLNPKWVKDAAAKTFHSRKILNHLKCLNSIYPIMSHYQQYKPCLKKRPQVLTATLPNVFFSAYRQPLLSIHVSSNSSSSMKNNMQRLATCLIFIIFLIVFYKFCSRYCILAQKEQRTIPKSSFSVCSSASKSKKIGMGETSFNYYETYYMLLIKWIKANLLTWQ